MGMFDTLRCELDLSHPEIDYNDFSGLTFQTKNFDNTCDMFLITKEGRVLAYKSIDLGTWPHTHRWETVETYYTGTLKFYTHLPSKREDFFARSMNERWIEFEAVVWNGQIDTIHLTEFQKITNTERRQIYPKEQ